MHQFALIYFLFSVENYNEKEINNFKNKKENSYRAVGMSIILNYLIRIVFDKLGMSKDFFFVNLFDMGKGKNFFR
jgi:hypothetical protein